MKIARLWLVACVSIGLLMACTSPPLEREERREEGDDHTSRVVISAGAYAAAGITVEPVGLRTQVPTIQVTGTLAYDERRMAIATARIGGRITRVIADYGQQVAAGEVLVWIDSPDLGAAQADLLRAVNMSRLRQAEYERAELLLQGNAISRGELLRREAEWRAVEAEMHTAEQKLHILGLSRQDIQALSNGSRVAGHEYPVRATIDGRVTERQAVTGRVVAADDELFTVARLDVLWLFLQVFEKDLPSVREGAAVTLTCESHPNDSFRGTIDFVGEVLDAHSRTVQARAVIKNPEGELKPGMFVYASIEMLKLNDGGESHMAVPTAAVTSLEGQDVVFVHAGDHAFDIRPVVLGAASQDWIEIRSGLSTGDTIAVSGVFTLKSELLKGGLEEHGH